MNRGLIPEPVPPQSLLKGASLPVRRPDGDWEPFLPPFEAQSKLGLETMNCVQFSFLNVLETIARSYGRTLDFSDRFLYWASGCTAQGNTYSKCLDGFLKNGCCGETLWSWLTAMSREVYGMEPPEDVRLEALRVFEDWEFGGVSYVPSTVKDFQEALKLSPLWFCNETHSMMMYRVDGRLRAFDTYGTDGKGSFGPDYVQHVQAAFNVIFTPKSELPPMPQFPFKENYLYQLVDAPGGFLMFAKGRCYRDTESKLLASFIVRNGGEISGKVGTVQMKDLQGVSLFDLKDQPTQL